MKSEQDGFPLYMNDSSRQRVDHKSLSLVQEKKAPSMSEEDATWLKAFNSYLEENLQNNILTIPELARQFTMSESSLLRQVKRLTGKTSIKYLQMIRLEKAKELLENKSDQSVEQVMKAVGYQSASSFARNFKQHFGLLPSEML